MPWAAYLWPGLPHLWIEGSWAGLLLAVAFTLLLNVLVLSTFVWPGWLSSEIRIGCGFSVFAIGLAAVVETRAELSRIAARKAALETKEALDTKSGETPPEEIDEQPDRAAGTVEMKSQPIGDSTRKNHAGLTPDEQREQLQLDLLFQQAQKDYLSGDWNNAEQKFRELYRHDRDDAEAGLMLATLLRHTKRPEEAVTTIDRLLLRESAEPWHYELKSERNHSLATQADETTTEFDATESDDDNHFNAADSSSAEQAA